MSIHGSLSRNTTLIWTRSRTGTERTTLRKRKKGWTWKTRTAVTEVIHGALEWIWIWKWRLKEKTDGIPAGNPSQTYGKHLKDVSVVCYGVPTTFFITSASILSACPLPFLADPLHPIQEAKTNIISYMLVSSRTSFPFPPLNQRLGGWPDSSASSSNNGLILTFFSGTIRSSSTNRFRSPTFGP